MLTPADIIAAVGTVANVGLLTGIFFKLGGIEARLTNVENRKD